MNVHIVQDAERQERDWWQWSVWLEGPKEELDRIDHVEYVLHSTFREPVKQRANRADNFRLDASGWGEFMLYANVHAKDGSVERHEHWVTLRDAPTRGYEMAGAPPSDDLEGEAGALTVYLAFSVADALIANNLTDELEALGVTVLTAEDVDLVAVRMKTTAPASAPQPEIDIVVCIISDVRSAYFTERDLRRLRDEGFSIIRVVVGDEVQLSADLADLPAIHLNDPGDVEAAAAGILAHLQDRAR